MIDERQLLEDARQGDRQAVTQLVMTYQDMVRRYLYALAPDPSVADDLAQDVFIKFIGAIGRIDPERGIKSYLMRMTRNMAMDHWRRLGRRREQYHEVLYHDLASLYEQRRADRDGSTLSSRLAALKTCLKRLNHRIYRVIMGFYFENSSCRELAAMADTNESNIRTRLYRGRKALLACIVKRTRNMESIK